MNSLEPLMMETPKQSVIARLASNWIEIFAIPVASCIMEAQPIALGLQFLGPGLLGVPTGTPLDVASIILLMSGLQWWAMFVHYLSARRLRNNLASSLSILGLLVALAVLFGTHLALLNNILLMIIGAGLVGWFWKRGRDLARDEIREDYLILAFKIGFVVLLVVLTFVIIYPPLTDLGSNLAQGMPLFFLSGLIALSFTRLAIIKKENANRPGSSQKSTTRTWIVALTASWGLIVATAIALEIFSFQLVAELFRPVWDILGAIASGILYVISFIVGGFVTVFGFVVGLLLSLLGKVFGSGTNTPQPRLPAPAAPAIPKMPPSDINYLLIGRLILLVVIIALLIWAIRMVSKKLRKKTRDNIDEEEEVREALAVGSILKARRDERRKRRHKEEFALETLDPTSVRARYRGFLQNMAAQDGNLARHPNETPVEYQKRLQHLVSKSSSSEANEPGDPAILKALTLAYAQERYGGKQIDNPRQEYLRTWVPRLVQRLTGSQPGSHIKQTRPSARQSTKSGN